jgi:predicted dehydrogenase
MSELKVGVAGLGRGREFVKIFDHLDSCTSTAVCDSNPEALKTLPEKHGYTDYDEFLNEELDIVAVITPGPAHAEQSVKALQSGAHVLCETPNVYSVDEARQVIAAAVETGKKYMLAENYLWDEWVKDVKNKCKEGLLGDIIYAEGDYTHDCRDLMLMDENGYISYRDRDKHPDSVKSWRATDLPPLTYCSHTLGPLLYLMDDKVTSVTGFSAGSRTAPDIGAIDLESALMQTDKSAVIRLTNGFTVAHPFSTFYKLVGTRGSVQFGSATGGNLLFYSDEDPECGQEWQEIDVAKNEKNSTRQMIEEFVLSIVNDTDLPLDEFRSMDMVLPGIIAHESALAGGTKLTVPDLNM